MSSYNSLGCGNLARADIVLPDMPNDPEKLKDAAVRRAIVVYKDGQPRLNICRTCLTSVRTAKKGQSFGLRKPDENEPVACLIKTSHGRAGMDCARCLIGHERSQEIPAAQRSLAKQIIAHLAEFNQIVKKPARDWTDEEEDLVIRVAGLGSDLHNTLRGVTKQADGGKRSLSPLGGSSEYAQTPHRGDGPVSLTVFRRLENTVEAQAAELHDMHVQGAHTNYLVGRLFQMMESVHGMVVHASDEQHRVHDQALAIQRDREMALDDAELEEEPLPPVPFFGRRRVREADVPILPEAERPYKRRRFEE